MQTAGSERRSQKGSRGNYGQDPAIKEHIRLSGRRGKKKRSGKINPPLITKLAGDEVMHGSDISNTQPSSPAIEAGQYYEGVGGDNGLPLRTCGRQNQPHDEVQLVPALPSRRDQSCVAEPCLFGGRSVGGSQGNSAVYSDIVISEAC